MLYFWSGHQGNLIEFKHSLQFLKNSVKIKLIISNNQMN